VTVLDPLIVSIADAVDELVTCVCDRLETHGGGPVCWCGLYPGDEVSWEFCGACDGDACGMAWVRLMGVFPYSTFPVPAPDLNCTLPLAWQVEVGALRCLPESDDLPAPDQLAGTSLTMMADATALYQALRCCSASQVAPELWTPLGPQGGCVGGAWSAYLAVE
jgi:hypothetical protein